MLLARTAGAAAFVSPVTIAGMAPGSGPVGHMAVFGVGEEGDKGPDSLDAMTSAAVENQECTVEFEHDSYGIGEGVSLALLFLVTKPAGCYEGSDSVTLGQTPFGGAKDGVDYIIPRTRIGLDESDGTNPWGFRVLEDDIPESGEGVYVVFAHVPSGVTVAGPDTARIFINDNDDPNNTVPGVPRGLSGTPGNERVTLRWSPPSSDGGATIRRYEYRHAVATDEFPDNWTTAPGGGNARSVTVTGLDNGTTYKFQVRARNDIGPGGAAETRGTPTSGSMPSLSIDDVTVGEAAGTARLTVALSTSSSEVVSVGWATADASAQEGSDYEAGSGTLTFPPNSTTRQVTVSITDDSEDENTEIFTVVLSNPRNATIRDGSGRVTITDNDATPSLAINNVTVAEGGGTATLRVTLTDGGSETVTVDWATENGSATAGEDYVSDNGTLTFTAGDTREDITVSITDDSDDESNETFAVALSNAQGATISDGSGRVSITDNDGTPSLAIDNTTVREDAGTATLRVTLANGGSGTVTVNWATENGSATAGEDYTSDNGTLTFTAGDTGEDVTVSITDDTSDENDEDFTVRLSNAQGATITDATGQVTIVDDDGGGATPTLAINDATVGEGAGTATLRVTLTDGGTGTVTVDWLTVDGSATGGDDYSSDNGTLTFTAGETTEDISISITDDDDDENTETFTVDLRTAQGATITDPTGQVTINDNDDDGPTVTPPSAPRTLAADPGDEQVELSWTPPASSGGGTISRYEYRHSEATDTLPGSWTRVAGGAGAREVTVGQLTNGITYQFQVRAVNEAGGGTPASTTAAPADPQATPALAVPDLTVGEGEGTAVVRVTLAPAATGTVTVSYETSDGSATEGEDYEAADGTLTFDAGTTAQDIRVTITNDADEEDAEDFTITLSDAEGADIGRASGQVTIQDNDPEATLGAPSAPRSLAGLEGDEEITLTWSPPADDGGKPIVRYEYRYAEGSGDFPGAWTVVSGGPTTRRIKIKGLKNGVAYRFQLHAVNEFGEGTAAREAATPKRTRPPPSLSIDDVSVGEGSETAVLRVILSETRNSEVSVDFATSNGTAQAGEDYTAADSTLTFDPGETLLEIGIRITDDDDEEGNESFEVELSNPVGGQIGDGTGKVTILDNDGDATAEAPDAPRDLQARAGDREVTLSWAVPASDGGAPVTRYEYRYAENAEPYPETWTTVSGGSGAREATVGGLDNGTPYDFEVRAVNEAGGGEAAQVSATPREATGEPALSIEDETVDEDDGVAVVRVTLSPASGQVVTVRYETEDLGATAGEDYSAARGTLSFNPGDTSEEIRVPIIDDEDDEASERFEITLSGATNATIEAGTAEVTIRDDDNTEGGEVPGAPRDFLGIGQNRLVELTWSAPRDDGGVAISHYEYRFVEGSKRFPLVWTPVDGGGRVRRLRVTQLRNGVTYRFQLRAVNGVGSGPPVLTEGTPVHPDSTPTIRIGDADVDEDDEEVTLTVTMTPAASGTVRVDYATADGTATAGEDYADTTGTLVFRLRSTRQTITVPVLDDEDEEGDETFSVTLGLVGDPDVEIAEGTATVTIRDNEGDTVATVPGRPRSLFGEGGDSLVTLTWRAPESDGGAPVTHYEYQYAEDGEGFSGRWTGIVGEGRARKVKVEGLKNGTRYRFQVRAVNGVGPGAPAETAATPGEESTRPSVSVSPRELEVTEGDSASYTIVLDSEPLAGVTVRMDADLSGTDLEVEPTAVVFTTSNWNEPQTVAVRSEADEDEEDDLGIALTHEASGGGYDDVDVPSVTVDILEFKPAPVPEVLGSGARAEEGARAELIFFLALTEATDNVVTVDFETRDGTAVAGEDYEEHSGTVVFVPGTITQGIAVPLLNDDRPEEDEALVVELFNPVNGTLTGGVERLLLGGTIIDDDEGLRVSFEEAAYEVDEGGDLSITVELSGTPEGEIRIPIEVMRGEGVEEGEFSVAEHVTFGGGRNRAEVELGTLGDDVDEDDETLVLKLGPTFPQDVFAGDPAATEVTIIDDDVRGVRLSPATLEVGEGDSASYTARLTSQPTAGVTLRMTADLEETSLTVEPVEVAFTPADWSEPQVFRVRSALDLDQDDELGISLVHEASGGDYDRVDEATVTVDVIDLKLPTVQGDDEVRAGEADGAVRFGVRLSAASNTSVSIDYVTVDGTAAAEQDYQTATGTLVFQPGTTLQAVVVPLLDDYRDEDDETFQLVLFNPVGATLGEVGDRLVLTGTIADDDETVTVSFEAGAYEVDEGDSVSIPVELNGDPRRAIRIPILAMDGQDVEDGEFSVAGSVLINRGRTSATLTFRSREDDVDEEDEAVVLELGASLPEGLVAGDPARTEITIVDDDERGVAISAMEIEVDEGASATYTVALMSQPTATVNVVVEGDWRGSDVTVNPARLSFGPQAWRNAKTVTLTAAHDRDAIDEPVVTLSHRVTGGDYNGVQAAGVTVTVIEDDTPVLTVPDAEGVEGDGEIVFEATLDIRSSREVRVNYVSVEETATENVDYTGRRGTLVFAPLQTSTRLVVPLIDDDIDEPAERFRLELSDYVNASPGEDPRPTTGTILDDDLPVLTIGAVAAIVAEGTDARFQLAREGDLTVTLSVPVTVVETGDFLAGPPPESVDFAVGAAEAILALPTVDDALDERDGRVEATIQASDDYEISGSPTTDVTVTDNDATPAVVVAGAQVAESAGEIVFAVTLRGASAYEVAVDWITGDGTARAGHDYEAATGRVTFAGGETVGEIRVAVVEDLLPEGDETFAVTLSGARNAVLDVGSATGTITDDDEAVVTAWLSRFGRTVGSQVVAGIGERLTGGMGRSQLNTPGAEAAPGGEGRKLGVGDLLDGSTFHFSPGAGGREAGGSGGGWTVWGRGMRTSFEGAEEGLSVDGAVLTALAGVDYEAGPVLVGVAGSYSLGEGTLARRVGGSSEELSQNVESVLNSVYPYLRVSFADRVSVWGLGGYGQGDMSFPGAAMAGETGIRMNMGALGARGALLDPEGAGISLALKSDAFLVRMSTDADAGMTSVEADVSRVRLLLEAASRLEVGAGGLFVPAVEVGVRMDDGDAETGTGVEVGGGVRYTNEAYGLSIEGTARMLVSHQDTAFGEWGAGGALVLQPGGPEQGLLVRMGTSWGASTGNADELWSSHAAGGVEAGGRRIGDHGGRFTARLHYAMSPFGDGLAMAPYAELGIGRGTRTSVAGWRLDVLEALDLCLETDLSPHESGQGAEGLRLRATLRR